MIGLPGELQFPSADNLPAGHHGSIKELADKYPNIFAFGEVLAAMRPQEDN